MPPSSSLGFCVLHFTSSTKLARRLFSTTLHYFRLHLVPWGMYVFDSDTACHSFHVASLFFGSILALHSSVRCKRLDYGDNSASSSSSFGGGGGGGKDPSSILCSVPGIP